MAKAKYLQFYELMMEQKGDLFEEFKPVHDAFQKNRDDKAAEEAFHKEGLRVVDVVRDWDRRLCAGMGKGQFSQYTQKLSETFWDRVRKDLPLIDLVGVKKRMVK
jgi:hypothetical protein